MLAEYEYEYEYDVEIMRQAGPDWYRLLQAGLDRLELVP